MQLPHIANPRTLTLQRTQLAWLVGHARDHVHLAGDIVAGTNGESMRTLPCEGAGTACLPADYFRMLGLDTYRKGLLQIVHGDGHFHLVDMLSGGHLGGRLADVPFLYPETASYSYPYNRGFTQGERDAMLESEMDPLPLKGGPGYHIARKYLIGAPCGVMEWEKGTAHVAFTDATGRRQITALMRKGGTK